MSVAHRTAREGVPCQLALLDGELVLEGNVARVQERSFSRRRERGGSGGTAASRGRMEHPGRWEPMSDGRERKRREGGGPCRW